MKKDYQKKLDWVAKRIQKKTGITKEQTLEVLGQIADLRWDWRKSKYDFFGLDISDVLHDLAEDRCPSDRIEDLS